MADLATAAAQFLKQTFAAAERRVAEKFPHFPALVREELANEAALERIHSHIGRCLQSRHPGRQQLGQVLCHLTTPPTVH